MGAGKTETYNDLNAQQVFASKDNLYAKELVRLFAIYKEVVPSVFTSSMLDGSRKYYSPEVFEAMGVAVKNDAAVTVISLGGVDQYIASTFGTTIHSVFYYSSTDSTDKPINIPAQTAKNYLDNEYPTSSNNYETSYSDIFTMRVQNNETYDPGGSCPDPVPNSFVIYQMLHPGQTEDTVSVDTVIPSYELAPGEWYFVNDMSVIDLGFLTLEKLDVTTDPGNWTPTGETLELSVPIDKRTIYLVKYAFNDPSCSTWKESDAFTVYKTDIIGEAHTYRFFIFPVKDNGEFVEHDAYQKVLLTSLGLGNGVLNESLADSRIVKSIISYSTDYNSEVFNPYIQEVYGAPGNTNQVVFNTAHYNITYSSTNESSGMINFDGTSFSTEGKYVYILPVDIFDNMILMDRYNNLNEILRVWANVSETTDLEWYQTGLFKLIVIIVTVIVAIYTGQWQMVGYAIGAKAFVAVFGEYLSPELMAVISIVLIVYAGDFSSVTGTFGAIANMSQSIAQLYFIGAQEDLTKQIESYKKQQEEAAAAVEEMKNETLYIPMESYSRYYDSMYSITTEAYTSVYDSTYSYDALLKPKLGAPNGQQRTS